MKFFKTAFIFTKHVWAVASVGSEFKRFKQNWRLLPFMKKSIPSRKNGMVVVNIFLIINFLKFFKFIVIEVKEISIIQTFIPGESTIKRMVQR